MQSDEDKSVVRAIVLRMMEVTGLDASNLARKAGLSPTTLTRFLNAPTKYVLSARSLVKLSRATGVSVPEMLPIAPSNNSGVLLAYDSMEERSKEILLRLIQLVQNPTAVNATSASNSALEEAFALGLETGRRELREVLAERNRLRRDIENAMRILSSGTPPPEQPGSQPQRHSDKPEQGVSCGVCTLSGAC